MAINLRVGCIFAYYMQLSKRGTLAVITFKTQGTDDAWMFSAKLYKKNRTHRYEIIFDERSYSGLEQCARELRYFLATV